MIGNPRRSAVLVALLVIAVSVGTGVAIGGDGGSTVFATDPDETEVAAGDELTVALTINTQGDLFGNGLNAYEFALVYHPDALEVTDVEHGDYLQTDGLERSVEKERDEGELFIRHEIADRENGVRGSGVMATVTFEVAEDAPAADLEVGYAETTGRYIGDHIVIPYVRNGTIAVEGGGDELTYGDWADENGNDPNGDDDRSGDDSGVANGDDAGADDGDDGVGVIRADDVNRTVEGDDDPTGEPGDDTIPGFGAGAVIGALVAAWLSRSFRR